MPKLSAGILVYRIQSGVLEVFIVHPGGPFWAKKDGGAWSLPKGEYFENEDPWTAAKREFKEETGQIAPEDNRLDIGEVKYSNKILTAWAVEGATDAQKITSNTFKIEWPPRTGRIQEFPEVDKAAWVSAAVAREKLVPGQVPLVERLESQLKILPPPTQTTLL